MKSTHLPFVLAAISFALAAPITSHGAEWSYENSADKMTGKTTKVAALRGEKTLSLKFPYAGNNLGAIIIRKKQNSQADVIFAIDKGQTLCQSYRGGCSVMIRFDDRQPIKFRGENPSDGSSSALFLSPVASFVSNAKKAKRILVAVELYQNGEQIVELSSIRPLVWE